MMSRFFQGSICVFLPFLLCEGFSQPTTAESRPRNSQFVTAQNNLAVLSSGQTIAPVMFIENIGQLGEEKSFQVRGTDRAIWLTEDAIWITVLGATGQGIGGTSHEPFSASDNRTPPSATIYQAGVNLKISFPGSNPHPRIEPFNRLDTIISYFVGNDPAKWRAAVPVWGGVRYVDLYPGIDLEVTSEGGQVVQRLVAAKDADLRGVALRVEGADQMTLEGGLLHLNTAVGEFNLPLLQVGESGSLPLPCPVVIGEEVQSPFGNSLVRTSPISPLSKIENKLEAPFYNPQFNPKTEGLQSGTTDLLYSTFLGGSGTLGEIAYDIAVDSSGAAYVTGHTANTDFPTTPGAFDTNFHTSSTYVDAYVVKMAPDGSSLIYATFLGGNGNDTGRGIAVDSGGTVYVAGTTSSSNFPTTAGAYETSFNSVSSFITKLNAAGSALLYSTYLTGGTANLVNLFALAIDSSGAAYVTGETTSSRHTTSGAYDTSFNGGVKDAFVAKLNPEGSALTYATLLGGIDIESGLSIAVDSGGAAYITGSTSSTDFPTTPGTLDTSPNGYDDAFIVKINPSGSDLVYATYLGGSYGDQGRGIAIDSGGSTYITGVTGYTGNSSDFPTTSGAYSTSYHGGSGDVFVSKLSANGSTLSYSSLLGGNSTDQGNDISIDSTGVVYITGYTTSANFPTSNGAFDTIFTGGCAFVIKLDPMGSGISDLLYSTFLGGSLDDNGYAIAIDSSSAAYVVGFTQSSNFPTTPGAFDTIYSGNYDVFVAKLAMRDIPWTLMFYLDGDNNLNGRPFDTFYLAAINALESAADNPNVKIVVFFDGMAVGDSTYYLVKPDADLNRLAAYVEGVDKFTLPSEADMAAPQTLIDFVAWAKAHAPARHYGLTIADHGTGLSGIALDGSHWMSVRQLGDALKTISADGAQKLDFFYADACLMGMIEVGYQIRNSAQYFIANENVGWVSIAAPHPYAEYVKDIVPRSTAREVSQTIVHAFGEWLDTTYPGQYGYAISAADLSQTGGVISGIRQLSADLRTNLPAWKGQIQAARAAAQKLDSSANGAIETGDKYIDLRGFAMEIRNRISDTTVQNDADALIAALNLYIVGVRVSPPGTTAYPVLAGSNGVSIFFPLNTREPWYQGLNLDFASDAAWSVGSAPVRMLDAEDPAGWGPLLIDYLAAVEPDAEVSPNPPDLAAPGLSGYSLFLPVLIRQ